MALSQLPAAGLGNKLFSWASGTIFSEINQCPHVVTGMTRFHLGPWLRGEKSKRFYHHYFNNERLFVPAKWWRSTEVLKQAQCGEQRSEKKIFIFDEIPPWQDLFHSIRDHRSLVVQRFWSTLTHDVKKRIETFPVPQVSVHIRMGDFKTLQDDEDFAQKGATRTPLRYFIHMIRRLRDTSNRPLKFTVFSDGREDELSEVLSEENVERAPEDLDIVHLAAMSKSQLIITSAGSTFSYWAGFLGDAVILHHPDHFHSMIRRENVNEKIFEGVLPEKVTSWHPSLKTILSRAHSNV